MPAKTGTKVQPKKTNLITPSVLNEEQEDTLIALKSERAKRSLYEFLKEFSDVVSPIKFVDNWHIYYLCSRLERIGKRILAGEKVDKHLIINCPPNSSKSMLCAVMLPAWLIANDPATTIICSSYSDDSSSDTSTKCKSIIDSDKFALYFPWVQLKLDRQNKNDYHTTMNGFRFSSSTKSSTRGRHAILLISDDQDDSRTIDSEGERKKTHDYLTGTLFTRKIDPERTYFIGVQQRMGPDDTTAFLIGSNPDMYEHIVLPAEYNEKTLQPASLKPYYDANVGLLDPVRLSRAYLNNMKKDMRLRDFNCQYNQNPYVSSDTQIVEGDWFPVITQEEFNKLSSNKHFAVDFYLDLSYTTDRKNDCSCIMATAKIDTFLYLLNISRIWLEFPDLCRHVVQWTKVNGLSPLSRIVVEPKASGISLYQTLRQNTGLNLVQGVALNKFHGNKKQRIINISPILEGQRCILVKGPWNRNFLEECSSFSGVRDDTDDQLDCLWMAVSEKLLRKSNYGKYNTR